uniref:RNAbinding protein putative n=1 Tax=Albugo laibachii Nc14 TaxID=890382 RepID=F0W9H4_9STRA|nr:RNAbinding protein putative [Albugo laibachii Nc14]|eukprot:CCA17788.1 RNAbinding protein putative [Albugo laibachii Nc14]
MTTLDDELARFEAELKALETSNAHDNGEDMGKSEKSEMIGSKVSEKTTENSKKEIAMAPKVYAAPPRPAPHRNESENAIGSSVIAGNMTTQYAALSGFPVGITGEMAYMSSVPTQTVLSRTIIPRVDMTTGQLLSNEEQQLMNTQQSVYGYDPNKNVKPKTSTQSSVSAPSNRPVLTGAKRFVRVAGGERWEDVTLAEWPDNDFRLFCGDLGNEVTDELLAHNFSCFPSFQRAKVIRDKFTHKSRGYGFVSFGDPFDCAKALREMNGKYIGNRPVKLHKSKWEDRSEAVARKKMKKKRTKAHLFGP